MDALFVIVSVLLVYFLLCNCKSRESFSLSNKPMATENSMLNRNPFDDIDYITPTFTMLR